MSNAVLGFCAIPALFDNTKLTTSPLGELSSQSVSFSKDIGVYDNTTYPNVTLMAFVSEIGNDHAALPDALSDGILKLCSWIYNQANAGNLTDSGATALQQLKAEFDSVWDNLTIGEMETNGTIWMPAWFSGNLKTNSEINVKIWFADGAFSVQYPRREYLVVGPVPDSEIDALFQNYKNVATRLAQETQDKFVTRLNAARSKYPESGLKTYGFAVHDTVNKPNTNDAYWTIVYYGGSAVSEDDIYEAIRNTILGSSKHTREEWEEVLPDLFNPMEFYLLPNWLENGIPNKTTQQAQYSPVGDYETLLDQPTKVFRNFEQTHIIKSLQTFPSLYKSINILTLGKPTNRDGLIKLRTLYPDYSLIPSRDKDFDLMTKATTDFILAVEQMLLAAETMTEDTEVPIEVSRAERDGVLYTTKTINGVKYLMVTKGYLQSIQTAS